MAVFLCTSLALITTASAKQRVPQNLGNGLDKIVESDLLVKAGAAAPFDGFATKAAASYAKMALVDTITGNYLVDVMPDGRVPVAALQASIHANAPLFTVTAVDTKYRGHGVIEGHVRVDDVAKIAQLPGVGSVVLQLKPILSAGQSTAQGVLYHRVNKINKGYNAASPVDFTGKGISIGVMSDSFDTSQTTSDRAAADELADELPAVTVLEDKAAGTDEGRGMCQIVHDIAPGAEIGFASASVGEVGFANNIRALAGLEGFTKDPAIQKNFKGDIVCDDVSYLDEPMYSDGIIAQGVIDVVNAGVTYASSAANNWGTDGYESVFRPVANGNGVTAETNSALANTNIDLTGVDPALFAGGFHNFNPNGMDVAMTTNFNADPFVFQWNDPYDVSVPQIIEPPIFEADDSSTGGSSKDYTQEFEADKAYVITVTATNQNPGDNFDAIVKITDPNGHVITDQDTGTDEVVTFFAPVTGTYTITVHPFATAPDPLGVLPPIPTQGTYHIKINNATGTARLTQDFNVLFFDMDGKYLPDVSFTSNNIAANRPIEIGSPDPGSQAQMVICRSNATAPANAANEFRFVFFGNGASGDGPAEYWSPLTPVTYGHSAAAGANSVAAYEAFKPNLPEDFTSLGPVRIFFDKDYNRLAQPEIRLKPDIAAADGVNTSFFPLGVIPFGGVPLVGDSAYDPDDFPNFYGTSAASPHCAALAALVLEAHGGKGSLTPAQVKTIFQTTAFPHDLDPYQVIGTASIPNGGKITIEVLSDNSANEGTGEKNPNTWSVSYTGPGTLKSLSFNPQGTPQTGGNPTGGNFNGSTPQDFNDTSKFRYTPGMVFTSAFSFGDQSVGLTPADVSVSRANPAPSPSNPSPANPTEHQWTLNLSFPQDTFTDGKVLRFNNGRLQQQDATVPMGMTNPPSTESPITNNVLRRSHDYSADILGDGVLIPEDPHGNSVGLGMTFSGTVADGDKTYTFTGRLTNKIGNGYSPLDGFGFINAEAAVAAAVPTATPNPSPGGVSLVNISGRLNVGTGDNVGIGGFIVQGATPKRVMVRGIGPSLQTDGQPVAGSLQDPVLELHDSNGNVTTNDNWRESQEAEIEQSGLAPGDDRESAIIATLPAGNHTAILRGANDTTGVGLVEVYDLQADAAELGNLSVRANIEADENVLIAGIIVRAGDPRGLVFRGIGPSLADKGVSGALQDPLIELHDGNGTLIDANDNWQEADNAADLESSGLAPTDDREAAVLRTLGPGNYTSIVRGVDGTTGVGLAEVYKLNQ